MSRALIVGIDDYPSVPLNCCIKDAEAVAQMLARNADDSPNFAIKLQTALRTKAELRESIAEIFAAKDDITLFYFSGHGFMDEFGGYIVTPDFTDYDEGISMVEILKVVNNSPATDRVVILDCCNSGVFGAPQITDNATHINEGVTILTAAGKDESALEIDGHGVFTNLLLAALDGGAADLRGKISPGSIYAYVDLAMGPFGQRPVFKTNITRFVSLRSSEPPISQSILRKLTLYFLNPDYEYPLDPSYEFTAKSAKQDNVRILKNFQQLERVGLLIPVGEEHIYFAAMHKKSCKLTSLGKHYWALVKEGKI
ncbi:MAG: caspase family protein [Spirochaetaceae bacterium]|nr:caspase family protein [Spirochaetaceae bacterium]